MVFFITEWLSADLVALLTLSALAVAGLVSPEEALAGFSNPAVVTTWAVFILSVGLSRTGVAAWIGRQVLKLGGGGEIRTLLVLMLVSALLSGFMNNVGVAALMLPVVLDICRRTGLHPARMLLPLALSAHLGGMTTLIGTPTNILVSGILLDYGLDPFAMFDFTPFGLVIVLAGVSIWWQLAAGFPLGGKTAGVLRPATMICPRNLPLKNASLWLPYRKTRSWMAILWGTAALGQF